MDDIVSDSNTSLAPVLRVNSNNVAVNTALAYDGLVGSSLLTIQSGASQPLIFNTSGANESGRITVAGAYVLKGGTTSVNGVGVAFPATQVASSDANTLDDYEEGTWTPTSTTGTNLTSIVHLLAQYTKVGRVVTLSGYFSATVTTGSTLTYATLAGLPFAVTLTQVGSIFEDVTTKTGFSQAYLSDLNCFFAASTALAAGPRQFTYTITYQV
jgi:hypothetical protein